MSYLAISLLPAFSSLVFDQPTVEIPSDPSLTQWIGDYPFKNTGKKPITITNVRTCCDCTTAKLEKKTYAPGESGKLQIIFKTENKNGIQEKHAVITTDDGAQPQVIFLKGKIETAYDHFSLSAESLRWEKKEARKPKIINVKVMLGSPYRISSMGLSNVPTVSPQALKTQISSQEKSDYFLSKYIPDERGGGEIKIIPPTLDQLFFSVLEIKTNFSNGITSVLKVNLVAL